MATCHIGDLLLQRGRETLPRLAKSAIPANRVSILTWLQDFSLPVVRGVPVQQGDIMYLTGGTESYHRTMGRNEFVSVSLDHELLRRTAADTAGVELAIATGHILRPPSHLQELLRSVLQSAFRIAADPLGILTSPLSIQAMQQSILQALVLCLWHSEDRRESLQRRHRTLLAKSFETMVEENLNHPVLIPEFCSTIGTSGRTLRSLCQEQFGVSPQRFVALRRLHRIRQALQKAEHGSATVTDIATGLGIWELGRFSVAYKVLFGEAPSATLRRPV